MSLGMKMKTDGTELSDLDLYGWIKEEECVCVRVCVICSQLCLTGTDHKG